MLCVDSSMSYLLKWVNDGGRQAVPATSLERDFASGQRFLELLIHEGAIKAELKSELEGAHPLEVFEAVCTAMDKLGCVYKPRFAVKSK